MGRILWVMPESGIGSRLTGLDVPLLDTDAAAGWEAATGSGSGVAGVAGSPSD